MLKRVRGTIQVRAYVVVDVDDMFSDITAMSLAVRKANAGNYSELELAKPVGEFLADDDDLDEVVSPA